MSQKSLLREKMPFLQHLTELIELKIKTGKLEML